MQSNRSPIRGPKAALVDDKAALNSPASLLSHTHTQIYAVMLISNVAHVMLHMITLVFQHNFFAFILCYGKHSSKNVITIGYETSYQ